MFNDKNESERCHKGDVQQQTALTFYFFSIFIIPKYFSIIKHPPNLAFSFSKQKRPVCFLGFWLLGQNPTLVIWKISMTLPIVINVPTRAHWLSKQRVLSSCGGYIRITKVMSVNRYLPLHIHHKISKLFSKSGGGSTYKIVCHVTVTKQHKTRAENEHNLVKPITSSAFITVRSPWISRLQSPDFFTFI